MEDRGIEPLTPTMPLWSPSRKNATETAISAQAAEGVNRSAIPTTQKVTTALRSDPALAALVAAWPDLPEAVRVGILAMVTATGCQSPKERG